MNLPRLVCALLLPGLIAVSAHALGQTESVTVTVYNQDRALVNEVRKMEIPQGTHVVEFKEVAETIDASSLQVRSVTSPEGFRVLDQNYEYDLITVPNLLDKYVGKPLKVVVPDPKGPPRATVIRDATLLANNEKPVFLLHDGQGQAPGTPGGEIYVGGYESVLLPELPEGLRPQPTLVWLVENAGATEQFIETSYLASKMNWRADYVLKVNPDSAGGSLSGWVTLDNRSGKAFKGARLKLVAGDVNLVSRPEEREMVFRKAMAAPGAAEDMHQEEFFEYHLYSLPRLVDIGNRQTKQVALLSSPSLQLEKKLIARHDGEFFDAPGREMRKQKVGVFLRLKNSKENGMGIPLPKGIVRAYQASSDGSNVFIGEDRIDHTGKDARIELKAGEAFDVVIERRQTDFKKLGPSAVRVAWELKLKNSKESAQRVEIEETLMGDWKINRSSVKYEKMDARHVRFVVDANPSEAGADTVVSYEADVTL